MWKLLPIRGVIEASRCITLTMNTNVMYLILCYKFEVSLEREGTTLIQSYRRVLLLYFIYHDYSIKQSNCISNLNMKN